MWINEQELQLVCAILPGLMLRYGQQGYTDSSAIQEAFVLARKCLNDLRKISENYIEPPNSAESKPVSGGLPCGEHNTTKAEILLTKEKLVSLMVDWVKWSIG